MARVGARARLGRRPGVIAYLDASALVKVVLDEQGAEVALRLWHSAVPIATTRISQAEIACAIESAVRGRRLGRERVPAGIEDGSFLWDRVSAIEVEPSLVDVAVQVGTRHGLRGLDAIHVASALELAEFGPTLVSWDERQRAAARAEGLPVYPETTTAALR